MSTTDTKALFAEFPPATPADWRKAAEETLEGAPIEKKLVTRTPEGIDLRPIYTAEDTAALPATWPGLPPFTRGADLLGNRVQGWHIAQEPGDTDPAAFNAALLRDLQRGQNAVSVPTALVSQLSAVLAGVDVTAVPVFVKAGATASAALATVLDLAKRAGKTATAVQGGVLADPLGQLLADGALPITLDAAYDDLAATVKKVAADKLALRVVGVNASAYTDAGANAVQELAFALATGVDYLRALAQRDVDADTAAPRFLFTYGLGSHVFMEIAKLRAARLLWARAVGAAGGEADAQRLVAHGRTTRWNKTVLDVHVNLLRTTAEAFAGVVGGCSGLTIGAFDECVRIPDDFSRRLARNLQIILDEECQLGRVVDPAGGSYYVEVLTQQLAEKAWALFQDIERRGGMAASVKEGYPQSLVEKTAADRISAVATRRDGVIGTNLHPNLREKLADVTLPFAKVAAGTQVKPLVARRRSEGFEALRRRTEAAVAKTGARPKVFLAGFGPRKQHAARAEFSTGFFAAAGFEAVAEKKGFETSEAAAQAALASGAPVVVLCSTDDTYPALVPPTAKALKAAAKAPIVVLAGLPADAAVQQQFKDAGVDEFIHIRANCEAMLAGFHTRLGL